MQVQRTALPQSIAAKTKTASERQCFCLDLSERSAAQFHEPLDGEALYMILDRSFVHDSGSAFSYRALDNTCARQGSLDVSSFLSINRSV